MKLIRWMAVLFLLGFATASVRGQVKDGGIGVRLSTNSVEITSLSTPLTFLSCSSSGLPADVAADCSTYGAQAVFSGINATGQGWGSLSVELTGYDQAADPVLGCSGDGFFQNCSTVVTKCNGDDTSCTLTVNFSQGNGSGIGCFGSNLTNQQNATCVSNGVAEGLSNIAHGTNSPYYNPLAVYTPGVGCAYPPSPNNPAYPPGAVCGSNDFAVTIGGNSAGTGNVNFNIIPDLDGGLGANGAPPALTPEPETFVMVGGAMLAMLILGLRKTRLV